MAKPVGRDLEKTLRDGLVRGLPIFAFSFYFLNMQYRFCIVIMMAKSKWTVTKRTRANNEVKRRVCEGCSEIVAA